MRIYNGAALVLDNNAPNSVTAGSTNFRVETGSVLRAAPTAPAVAPLGATGNPKVTLAGGTLSLQGTPDGTYASNALTQYGFHAEFERLPNLDGTNGVVTKEGVLARVAYDRVPLTSGPLGTGLNFGSDANFISTGAVNQGDSYANVWLGYLNVTTPGNYEFRVASQDDRAGIWLDLNDNGTFESTTGGLQVVPGTTPLNNGELIVYSNGVSGADNATKTYNLAAGQYLVAVTHAERDGGSVANAYIKSPTMAGQALINPTDATQAGLWSYQRLGDINAPNTNLSVASSSTLSALTDRTATLGSLNFEGGATAANAAPVLPNLLTVSGGGTVRFSGGTNLTSAQPVVSYVVPAGTIGAQAFTGSLGMDFDLLEPTVISRLGVFDSGADGLSGTLNVRLYDRTNTATPLATLTFSAADPGTLVGGSLFKDLATPLVLPAGFRGSIVADGFSAADPNGNTGLQSLGWTYDSFNGSLLFTGSGRNLATPGVYPTGIDGGPVNRYAAGTFTYTPGTYSGINALAATTVYPGSLNGFGAPNRFVTQGMGDVILDQPSTGLENTLIETTGGGGRLIVANPATVAGATLSIGAPLIETVTNLVRPGNLILASPDGNDVTYPNRIGATAAGNLIAGTGGVGTAGGALILPDLKPTEGAIVSMKVTPGEASYILLPNGVNSPGYTVANALAHYGYHMTGDVASDLSASNTYSTGAVVGGMWNGGRPAGFQTFFGKGVLTTGPANRGLDYNDDYDFMLDGSIGRTDTYSDLFVGTLTVTAANAGTWTFRMNQQDDNVGVWIDLNRNGQFDSSTPGVGDNRGEQVVWNAAVTRTVNLAAGDYLVAFTHREGTGGSGIEIQYAAPGGTLAMINPSLLAQANLWSMPVLGGGLDIAQGEVRTLDALTLGTLILSPGGTLNRMGGPAQRDITVTERLELHKSLDMTHGETLTTTGAAVQINPGATLFVNQAVNAGDLNVQGTLARSGAGSAADVTVTRSMTLNSAMDFTGGGTLTSAGASLNVGPSGSLITTAPIVAKSLASAGTVNAPGAAVADLVISSGTTTLTGNITVTNSLLGGNAGTLATQGNIGLDVSAAKLVNLNSNLRVESGTLTITPPTAGGALPAGLQGYYSAAASAVTGTNAAVSRLYDLSDFGRDMANVQGAPLYVPANANGMPAVRFYATDGADAMWTDFNFDAFPEYSVVGADRLTGGANARIFTSRTRNWLFSHQGGGDARWHADAWITGQGGTTNTLWDVCFGTINGVADPQANFWFNGSQTVTNGTGSSNTTYTIGQLQFGAYSTTYGDASNGEFTEFMVFNRVLTATERNAVASYLASRYGVANTYTPTAFTDPALLGDLQLAPGTQATVVGSGIAAFNSIGTTTGPVASGGIAVSGGAPTSLVANAGGDTLTVNATAAATNFNVTAPSTFTATNRATVALTQNLTIASGGRLSVAQNAAIQSLNSLTIDASGANVDYQGGLDVAAGTLTLRTPAVIAMPSTANNIGYWQFNDAAGTTAADSSAGNNTGTLNGNPTWVNDPQRGSVISFNGERADLEERVIVLLGGKHALAEAEEQAALALQPIGAPGETDGGVLGRLGAWVAGGDEADGGAAVGPDELGGEPDGVAQVGRLLRGDSADAVEGHPEVLAVHEGLEDGAEARIVVHDPLEGLAARGAGRTGGGLEGLGAQFLGGGPVALAEQLVGLDHPPDPLLGLAEDVGGAGAGEHVGPQRLAVEHRAVDERHVHVRGVHLPGHIELGHRALPVPHHAQELEEEDAQLRVGRVPADPVLKLLHRFTKVPLTHQFLGFRHAGCPL